eukprot:CAMPEP_0183515658 /NCGR_PEP_ID=MMETSP0371-20130417/13666_1 /TAXON_ID=268820 /ORGANISM="Peridinium aciculiferum, Strain PAER-2" /LENGTH=161 /DNA_ID=CAMNT_0025713247 /DNA_START=246 /DNA_END=727 /DNA_ORIENTATION=+
MPSEHHCRHDRSLDWNVRKEKLRGLVVHGHEKAARRPSEVQLQMNHVALVNRLVPTWPRRPHFVLVPRAGATSGGHQPPRVLEVEPLDSKLDLGPLPIKPLHDQRPPVNVPGFHLDFAIYRNDHVHPAEIATLFHRLAPAAADEELRRALLSDDRPTERRP